MNVSTLISTVQYHIATTSKRQYSYSNIEITVNWGALTVEEFLEAEVGFVDLFSDCRGLGASMALGTPMGVPKRRRGGG